MRDLDRTNRVEHVEKLAEAIREAESLTSKRYYPLEVPFMKTAKHILLLVAFVTVSIITANELKITLLSFILDPEVLDRYSFDGKSTRVLTKILMYYILGATFLILAKFMNLTKWIEFAVAVSGVYLLILAVNGGIWEHSYVFLRLSLSLPTFAIILYLFYCLEDEDEKNSSSESASLTDDQNPGSRTNPEV